MPELSAPRHVVFVRHGESEGDQRRAMGLEQPKQSELLKHPRDEEQTALGHEQSQRAGAWIAANILDRYGVNDFAVCLTSPLTRTMQSAQSLGRYDWRPDSRLTERDRGSIQGMTSAEHQANLPTSYEQMRAQPFDWVPDKGESMSMVAARLTEMLGDVTHRYDTVLCMTHRDLMWATYSALDGVTERSVGQMDTSGISNGHIFHYTNIDPESGQIAPRLHWRQQVDPASAVESVASWQYIENAQF